MSEHVKARIERPGPKRILALAGGGTRGIITLAFLEEIERVLAARSNKGEDFRLSDYFDLISGTSVGSMLATMLALGYSVAEVKERFEAWAPKIFRKPFWRLIGYHPKFDARQLSGRIKYVLQDLTLESDELKTGLAIMMKRLDTGSPWIVTNNPNAKYWQDPAPDPATGKTSYLGNRHYKLFDLVRASTAAPYFFAPKAFPVVAGEADGVFVDGGVSPHNNPALQSLMLAGIKGYGFNWGLGAEKLFITSIGTGQYRTRIPPNEATGKLSALLGINALQGLIADNEVMALTLLQWLSSPRRAWEINSEIGDLSNDFLGGHISADKSLLSFQHYDVRLEEKWLQEELDMQVSQQDLHMLRQFDNPKKIKLAYELGLKAVAKQVQDEDFPAQFDVH